MLDELNYELASIGVQEQERAVDLQYNEMMGALYSLHEMEMYASHSHDLDCEHYHGA